MQVEIFFAGVELSKSPYKVNVEDCPADPSKVTAKGPGLQPGNVVGKETHFDVFTQGTFFCNKVYLFIFKFLKRCLEIFSITNKC